MAEYTIELSEAELKGMKHVCIDPNDWIQNAFQHRVYTAIQGLSDLEIAKAMKAGKEIVTDREKLVELSDEPLASERISPENYNPNPDDPFKNPNVRVI